MFYCEKCRKKYAYPESIMKSSGPCEICGEVADCNDVATKNLP
jgi:hypothetical protein